MIWHGRFVEDASRFARELVTQELGIIALIKRGMRVLTANGDDLTDSSDPSRKMMRQIAGSFHEYEKISGELAAAGYLNEHGRPFAPNSIRNMLAEPRRVPISDQSAR